jgi:hypothetical protein
VAGKVGQGDEVRARRAQEAWKQRRVVRDRIAAPERRTRDCDPTESYDEFLMGVACCTEAVKELSAPVQDTIIVKPQRWDDDGQY